MEELIGQIASKYGISQAQAGEIVNLVLGFVKQQVPGLAGQLEGVASMLGAIGGQAAGGGDAADAGQAATDAVKRIFG
jgi:hypothetical protein